MKKGIAVKALSAGLCIVAGISMASCATAEATTATTESEETEVIKPVESSVETTTVETTEETTEETSEVVTVNPYEEFINGYKDAIINPTDTWYYGPGVDTSDYMNLGQGLIVPEIQNGFSYTLFDIDKDGTPELVIGGLYLDYYNNPHIGITGVVTIDGDGYKIVDAGWSRSSLEYTGEGYFWRSGSGGAALHYDAVYVYDGVNKELATVGAMVTEYTGGEEVVAHYSYFTDINDAYHASPAYGDSRALCFDQEAEDKYKADVELATSKNNELLDAQWIQVDCH